MKQTAWSPALVLPMAVRPTLAVVLCMAPLMLSCADAPCHEDEIKVGTVCLKRTETVDSAAEADDDGGVPNANIKSERDASPSDLPSKGVDAELPTNDARRRLRRHAEALPSEPGAAFGRNDDAFYNASPGSRLRL